MQKKEVFFLEKKRQEHQSITNLLETTQANIIILRSNLLPYTNSLPLQNLNSLIQLLKLSLSIAIYTRSFFLLANHIHHISWTTAYLDVIVCPKHALEYESRVPYAKSPELCETTSCSMICSIFLLGMRLGDLSTLKVALKEFFKWMGGNELSLLIITSQAHKLAFISLKLKLHRRQFHFLLIHELFKELKSSLSMANLLLCHSFVVTCFHLHRSFFSLQTQDHIQSFTGCSGRGFSFLIQLCVQILQNLLLGIKCLLHGFNINFSHPRRHARFCHATSDKAITYP
ncbi:Myosin-binding protein 7 [Senna tora]|uniref:Myosin-binding protein 7 n=1 Tax=Senna tora TaxID=362788 RepID=A0A834SMZ4_9FABA|nr:Myosin-binding protein 7 [Senna tora]